MTIIEAEKEFEKLQAEIAANRKDNDWDSYTRYCGRQERKPLQERADKLISAIIKAKEITEVEV